MVHGNQWRAQIRDKGRLRHIGVYPSIMAAGRAHDRIARKLCGEEAVTNFLPDGQLNPNRMMVLGGKRRRRASTSQCLDK